MPRPQIEIDPEKVEALAARGCTYEEIAVILSTADNPVSVRTLKRRFGTAHKRGMEKMKVSLRRMQFKTAEKGNVTMQIWLGKQYLGQKDESAIVHTDKTKTESPRERLARRISGLSKRVGDQKGSEGNDGGGGS